MSDSKVNEGEKSEKKTDSASLDGLTVKKLSLIILCVVLVISGVLGVLIQKKIRNDYLDERSQQYYAVFLSNGQVYFGHLWYENSRTPVLTDIYYFKVVTSSDSENQTTSAQYSLVKLGKELHGPRDQMNINRDHLLFWEELGEDSAVLKAIQDYKNGESVTVPASDAGQYVNEPAPESPEPTVSPEPEEEENTEEEAEETAEPEAEVEE